MYSCLSVGGRSYALDLELIKSPSHSTRTSHTSSPSSTLSEASNSPIAISTRKARTPRKRPKQTYNEATALLSTAYPNVFSTKHITNPSKFTKPYEQIFDESAELLLPFRVIDASGFLLRQPLQEKPIFPFERKATNFAEKVYQSNDEVNFQGNSVGISGELHEDFDAESILDEEIEEGIDSIMGNLGVENEAIINESSVQNYWYENPMGIEFGGKMELVFGIRNGVRALRQVDEGNWWSFPTVDIPQISPKINNSSISNKNHSNNDKKTSSEKKKKKVATGKRAAAETESKVSELPRENSIPKSSSTSKLLLKLQYDDVLNAWRNRGSPFLDESSASYVQGNDVSARLARIDLFSDSGVREASVLRYKGKRRTRLFSKKIRYQVRKVNADRRPRMKGRFVRRPNSSSSARDKRR